ncbi:hypothetical protein [Streptomyces melanosporofaciens]|uniref:hypothetical protein n=1 Tax=Streptomyces melanosporofaciens TaxID=67327 RepID=UPI003CC7AE01
MGERPRQTPARAHAADQSARQTLESLVNSYVGTVLDCRDLLAAYLSEGHNLPDRRVAEARRFQRAYARRWADVVQLYCRTGRRRQLVSASMLLLPSPMTSRGPGGSCLDLNSPPSCAH